MASAQVKPKPPRRKPRLDFSVTGLIYCTMMMFIGLAAINTQANLLFGVFGLMIGILLVSFSISGLVLQRIKVTRSLPDHLVVGQAGTMYYQVLNRKRFWPSLAVTVQELDADTYFGRTPTAYMLHAANRMTATIASEVLARQRGIVPLNRLQISTSFPFGFIKRASERRQTDTLLILPAIGTMRRDIIRRFRSARSSGINVRPSQGGDDEFYGVREYRHGENPRRIYWKRSAGAGPLVVKEMTRVSPPRLVLLVDTLRRGDGVNDFAAVERTIAMAATMIDSAMSMGLPVGLVAYASPWAVFKPELGKRHRLDLLGALATLPENLDVGPNDVVQHARDLLKAETTAVLVTPYKAKGGFDAPRGGLIVLPAEGDTVFDFSPEVNFAFGHAAG